MKARGIEVYKLEYRQKCDKLLDKIKKHHQVFGDHGGKYPRAAVGKLIQFLYMDIITDPKKRVKKVDELLKGNYNLGDDLLLRMAYSFITDIKNIQREINRGFREEIKQHIKVGAIKEKIRSGEVATAEEEKTLREFKQIKQTN